MTFVTNNICKQQPQTECRRVQTKQKKRDILFYGRLVGEVYLVKWIESGRVRARS
jgi:hypothetical protein